MTAHAPCRDLRLLTGAVFVSAAGDFLALIPLALHLEEHGGSPLALAGLFVCLWGPSVVLAGLAGVVADRVEARRLLIVVSLAQAAIAVALAFSGGSTGALLALAALLGCANALASPAEFALVPAVAGERRLVRANGLVETARYGGMAAGPVLGGLVAAGGGLQVALLVDAATFVAVAVAAVLLHARRQPAVHETPPRARDGFAVLAGAPQVRLVLGVAVASLLTMTGVAAAEVVFVSDVLDAGELGYGAWMASWMAGMGLGALVLAQRIPPAVYPPAALALIVAQGTGLALPAAWLALGFAIGAAAFGGVAHGAKNVVVRTLIHRSVEEAMCGRAFAAYNGLRNGAEMAALALGGLLLTVADARTALVVAGGGAIASGLAGLALWAAAQDQGRSLRRTAAEPA